MIRGNRRCARFACDRELSIEIPRNQSLAIPLSFSLDQLEFEGEIVSCSIILAANLKLSRSEMVVDWADGTEFLLGKGLCLRRS